MNAMTAKTIREGSLHRRLAALVVALAAIIAIAVSIAPGTAWAEDLKVTVSTDRQTYCLGDTVTVTIQITNWRDDRVGSLTAEESNHLGDLNLDKDSLEPGQSVSASSTYEVTLSDLNAGSITFRVRAEAGLTNGGSISGVGECTVKVVPKLTAEILTDSVEVSAAGDLCEVAVLLTNNTGSDLGGFGMMLRRLSDGAILVQALMDSLPPGATTLKIPFKVAEGDIDAGGIGIKLYAYGTTDPNKDANAYTEKTVEVKLAKPSVADCDVELGWTEREYSGGSQVPGVTVKHGEEALAEGEDYKVSLLDGGGDPVSEAADVGGYKLRIEGTGNYGGSVDEAFSIAAAPVTITAKDQEYVYNGETQGPGDKAYIGAAQIADVVIVDGLKSDDSLASMILDGQGQAVGSSPLVPGNAVIKNTAGEDVTGNYDITYVNGTLTIESAPVQEYTVTFVNWDGTVLQSGKVAKGETPKYEGAEPTRPSDEKYTYAFSGWEPAIAEVTGDATYTAKYTETPKGEPAYKVVSGAGGTWTQGSSTSMTFKVERTVDPETAYSHFTGILVDGKAVSEKDASGKANWTARSGSVIVELQPSYLATLSAGKHTVTVTFDDADPVSADFTVSAKAATPATGDSLPGATVVLIVVALVALGAAIAAFVVRRRIRG